MGVVSAKRMRNTEQVSRGSRLASPVQDERTVIKLRPSLPTGSWGRCVPGSV